LGKCRYQLPLHRITSTRMSTSKLNISCCMLHSYNISSLNFHYIQRSEMMTRQLCRGLGGALINIKYFIEANIAASRIFEMIHRVVDIDSAKELGKTISEVKGEVEFRNIDFEYPSRPGSLVLSKFNLKVMACQTVGLVGISGSGKSTVINLLEKFYEPLGGHIQLDGVDIKTLQLKWLRSQMGLVSQETILFATSIKQNICFGKEEASMEAVMEAAKAANAHNFCQLPEGYNTLVSPDYRIFSNISCYSTFSPK